MKFFRFTILIATIVLPSGCATTVTKWDAENQRSDVLDMMEDQVMTNVIRASQNRLIMQFDYAAVEANVKRTVGGSFTAGQTSVHSINLANTNSTVTTPGSNFTTGGTTSTAPGAALATVGTSFSNALTQTAATTLGVVSTLASSATRTLGGTANANQDNTLSVTMAPVTDHNEVYEAYEYFTHGLSAAKFPKEKYPTVMDNSKNTNAPLPTSGGDEPHAHLIKKIGEVTYWIPERYAQEYFNLCLIVTAKRGGSHPDKYTGDKALLPTSVSQASMNNYPPLQSSAVTPGLASSAKPTSTQKANDASAAHALKQLQIDTE